MTPREAEKLILSDGWQLQEIQGIADKIDPQIGVDFFVRTRRQT